MSLCLNIFPASPIIGHIPPARRSSFQERSPHLSAEPWARRPISWRKKACSPQKRLPTSCLLVQHAIAPKLEVFPTTLEDLEAPPLNLYRPKQPYTATVVSVESLVGPTSPGDTCHIVVDHGGNVPYWEGQSYGIIPPGENPRRPGAPHSVRLYSIASSRYGDSFDGRTASLCVRRAVFHDPETGRGDPSKNGICSNFLCSSRPGDEIQITGPAGKMMVLPEDDEESDHIMVGTGTGVAPFRGYLRRMFMEAVRGYVFRGRAWLLLGVANEDSLLYHEEFSGYARAYPERFRYGRALSREQRNRRGGKMYVQDLIQENGEELLDMLRGGAHIYFCGLKGMMPGVQDALRAHAADWDHLLSALKRDKKWHVEVY